jgi:hypothetical protein
MGDSFKHHAQALIGYVDEIMDDPVAGLSTVADQSMIGMTATY